MYNILICDDQPDIVNALKIYLKPEGYELLTAQNQQEYEAFVLTHPAGEFTQSLRWPKVKK